MGNETKFAPDNCPKCKSDNITSDNSEMHKGSDAIGDYIICKNCDCEWYEIYNFSHIEIVGE